MPVRLGRAALLLERAAERVVRVVVGRRELLDDRPELALGLLPAVQPEVRDAERLADRRLLGLEPLRLLERDGRLRGHALSQPRLALAEVLVRLRSSQTVERLGARAEQLFDGVEDRGRDPRLRRLLDRALAARR